MTDRATLSSLGARIRAARLEAEPKVTIAMLARELDVDPRTVAGWQAGRSVPSVATLLAIARVLNRPPSYFLETATEAA